MKKFLVSSLAVLAVGLAGCEGGENSLQEVRTPATPMLVELPNLPVTVYKIESRWEVGGECGSELVGIPPNVIARPRQCMISHRVPVREEHLSLRLHFPAGSELAAGQTEKVTGLFSNDEVGTSDQGYISISIKSKFHRYDGHALRNIPVVYGQMNDIVVRLK